MYDHGSELRQAFRETSREVERIAAGLVRSGVPLWDAIERAQEIFRRRQAAKEIVGKR